MVIFHCYVSSPVGTWLWTCTNMEWVSSFKDHTKHRESPGRTNPDDKMHPISTTDMLSTTQDTMTVCHNICCNSNSWTERTFHWIQKIYLSTVCCKKLIHNLSIDEMVIQARNSCKTPMPVYIYIYIYICTGICCTGCTITTCKCHLSIFLSFYPIYLSTDMYLWWILHKYDIYWYYIYI